MTFKDSLENIKLDLTKIVLIPSGGLGGLDSDFMIKPKDFLKYAKEDLHPQKDRGIINSISNAKRAIDCQIDEVLYSLGVDFRSLPESLKAFVMYFSFKDDLSYKLKIIQGLNLAPGLIIAKARTLRNKLEHFYKIPTLKEVKEAIDIADLFIRSIEGKCKIPTTEFYLTDEKNFNKGFNFKNGYFIHFDFDSKKLNIHEEILNKGNNTIDITINDSEYFGFIRLMNSIDDDIELTESFKVIAHLINHPIPTKHIKLKQY